MWKKSHQDGVRYALDLKIRQAKQAFDASLRTAHELRDDIGIATNYCELGRLYGHAEYYEIAEDFLNKSLKLFERLDDWRGVTACLIGFADMHLRQGKFEEMEGKCLRGKILAESCGLPESVNAFKERIGIIEKLKKGQDVSIALYDSSYYRKELGPVDDGLTAMPKGITRAVHLQLPLPASDHSHRELISLIQTALLEADQEISSFTTPPWLLDWGFPDNWSPGDQVFELALQIPESVDNLDAIRECIEKHWARKVTHASHVPDSGAIREWNTDALRKLSLQALIAFSARCARRVQPVYALWADSSQTSGHVGAIEEAILIVETSVGRRNAQIDIDAAQEVLSAVSRAADAALPRLRRLSLWERLVGKGREEQGTLGHAASFAAWSARSAFRAAVCDDSLTNANEALVNATAAAQYGDNTVEGSSTSIDNALAIDYWNLLNNVSSAQLANSIDLSEEGPLGPLWPDGPPAWYRNGVAVHRRLLQREKKL